MGRLAKYSIILVFQQYWILQGAAWPLSPSQSRIAISINGPSFTKNQKNYRSVLYNTNESSQAQTEDWKKTAEKIRLEAQEMEMSLIREKLEKVEIKLKKATLSVEERKDVLREQASLNLRLNPDSPTPPVDEEITEVFVVEPDKSLPIEDLKAFVRNAEEQKQDISKDAGADADEVESFWKKAKSNAKENYNPEAGFWESFKAGIQSASEDADDGNTENDLSGLLEDQSSQDESFDGVSDNLTAESIWQSNETEWLGSLSAEDLQVADSLFDFWLGLKELISAGIEPGETPMENRTSVLNVDMSVEQLKAGNISQQELDGARNLAQIISFLKSVAPVVFYDAMEDYKMAQMIEMDDPLYLERKNLYSEFFRPSIFSRTQNSVAAEEATKFCEQVVDPNSKLFARTAKPKPIGGAYLIDGRSLEVNGDKLVSQLQDSLQSSPDEGKVNFFYIQDPSPQIELDEVQQADLIQNNSDEKNFFSTLDVINKMEPPAILVTGNNVGSVVSLKQNLGFSALSIASLAFFAGHCYNPDSNPVIAMFVGFQSPILWYVLGTFCVQHLVQLLAAIKGGFSVSTLPTMIPGVGGLPIISTKVCIQTPPKNRNDLFDFAFAGPVLAFLLSYGMIVLGLETTMQASNAAIIKQLPTLDLEFLKYSFLTSATIESIMGSNLLLSLGDTTSSRIPCDPLTISGHIGLMIHAIQLLPSTVDSNGGRLSHAVLGRFSAEYGVLSGFTTVFLIAQAYRGGMSALYFVALMYFSQILFDSEIPCLNDVDKASTLRLALFAGTTLLACLTLSPA